MPNDLVAILQVVAAVASAASLSWVAKQLMDRNGQLAPRWYSDQEHEGRISAEARVDRLGDLIATVLDDRDDRKKGRGAR